MANKNNMSVTPKPRTPKREVSVEAINQRAYQLFEARGSSEAGQAVEDWLDGRTRVVRRRTRRVKVPRRLAVIPLREGCRLGGNHSAR